MPADRPSRPVAATIAAFDPRLERECEALIAALPEWFGIPESNRAYLRNLSALPSWVALVESRVGGAVTLERHFPAAYEIHFIAVRPELHGRGLGRMLLDHVEGVARDAGATWLHVKTLGPSHADPFYARTREFYAAMGFAPLFETTAVWGERNPALVMVKSLAAR